MADYSKLSDFEINKAVAISVGFPCYYGDGSYTNNHGLRGAIVKGKNDSGIFMLGEFNPCLNPGDAWLIIVDNKIALIACLDGWIACPYGSVIDGDTTESQSIMYVNSWNKATCFADNNPLRAAMIVYLMMKDAEK